MILEVHVSALEGLAILDDYIGDEVKDVWREMEIERNVAIMVDELVETVVKVAVNVNKWTLGEYKNIFFRRLNYDRGGLT